MAVKDTTKITKKLVVTFSITDKKRVSYSLENPSNTIDYQNVADWANGAVAKEAFVIDGLPVTGLYEAYIETVTKQYLEAE